jgi:regulator of cell morphogenesis and NO signaling
MIFNKEIKMADVILNNHHLLSVISRFGIELGFGDQNISEVCKAHQVNVDFFLEIINAFNEPTYLPENHLHTFPLSLIISYLKNTHTYYMGRKIPEIQGMIDQLLELNKESTYKELSLLDKFFKDYSQHLSQHIDREEKVVYPYILRLEEFINFPDQFSEDEIEHLRVYAIERYVEEHDDIEESLFELKSLMIKYLPPINNKTLCYKILGQLGHLERDIKDHSNMENKVLVPRVRMMEEKL